MDQGIPPFPNQMPRNGVDEPDMRLTVDTVPFAGDSTGGLSLNTSLYVELEIFGNVTDATSSFNIAPATDLDKTAFTVPTDVSAADITWILDLLENTQEREEPAVTESIVGQKSQQLVPFHRFEAPTPTTVPELQTKVRSMSLVDKKQIFGLTVSDGPKPRRY